MIKENIRLSIAPLFNSCFLSDGIKNDCISVQSDTLRRMLYLKSSRKSLMFSSTAIFCQCRTRHFVAQ